MLNRPTRETRSCATNRKTHPPAPVTRRAFRCGCDVTKTTTFLQRAEIAAREFVSGKTQADAYRKAYPSSLKWKPDVVHSKASTFFADGRVRERVKSLQDAAAKRNNITADRVIRELSSVALAEGHIRYEKGVKLEVKASDKTRALELLGRHFGIFNDKMTHSFDFSSLTDEQLQAIVAGRA